jgi:lysozyme
MPRQLVLSADGLAHIKRFEGFRAETYDDLSPKREIEIGTPVAGTLTIGYGHIGKHAFPENSLTRAEAEDVLLEDLTRFEMGIKRLVKVPLTQGEYDGLVGFTFNIGVGAFSSSTLLRKLNSMDYDGASMEFERWVYSKGRKLRGLMLRRVAERAIFTGMASYSLLDLGEMAAEAEDLLGVGSNVRPDAVEGLGLMKPKRKSKTMLTGGLGLVGSFVGYFADLDRTVQLVLLACAFGYVIFNRYLEWKAGEH